MNRLMRTLMVLALAAAGAALANPAQAQPPVIGIVIMHGKGGSPNKFVDVLANALAARDYLVANLEMPWSGRRDYDASVSSAVEQVQSALGELRNKGAQKLFVAGHSQGGAFAVYFASRHKVDGVIAIAPGGATGSTVFREKLGESVARARQAVAVGQGGEKQSFLDYEGSRGTSAIVTTAAIYLDWFDPEGAMNLTRTALAIKPQTPVLWIVAKNDYPGLRKANIPLYQRLPANPLNAFYEPNSNHVNAPAASADEILRWTGEVAQVGAH